MKKIIFLAIALCLTSGLFAQNETTFPKHEVRVSVGDALYSPAWARYWLNQSYYFNVSASYMYRPIKWLWVGGSFVNYFGERLEYNTREYDNNGNFTDHQKSKPMYSAAIAPEIRFSYLNRKSVILYSAVSGGVVIEDGYDNVYAKYPYFQGFWHATFIGVNCYLGERDKVFVGCELGFGCKNLAQVHFGYRF